ncbi:MAG: 1-acyl-sn-glycerol-3-phosphate acyltransferase [Methylophilaceae bacterium]|jgi:1-acyl-sn-glycerol-3-phosphate acyltransferase|tara:strand:- start:27621 stop:28325 length:705 start_codon:yes stop_codon:yes gene_type:complete
MLWIRSVLFLLGLLIVTPIFSILVILLFPLPDVMRSRIASGWAHFVMFWLRLTCNLDYQVRGQENMPDHPSIILSKHQSAWETIGLQIIFPPQVWVMKRSLLLIPFLGWAFVALAAIPIDRSAGREALKKLVANGKDRLARGLWVVIFPEGTRTAPGEKSKYHIGGAWLAAKTETTVVPVAHNAGKYWRKNAFIKHPGTIQVVIGEPIETAGLKPDQVNKQVEAWIETTMSTLD